MTKKSYKKEKKETSVNLTSGSHSSFSKQNPCSINRLSPGQNFYHK